MAAVLLYQWLRRVAKTEIVRGEDGISRLALPGGSVELIRRAYAFVSFDSYAGLSMAKGRTLYYPKS